MNPAPRTRLRARTLNTLALCALTALVLSTGCTADPEPDSTPTDPTSTPSVDEVQAAGEAAEAALRAYYQTSVQCLADPPNTDPSCFDQVSIDQVLQSNRQALADAQEYEWHYVGDVTVVSVEVGDVDLDSIAQVEATACVDATTFLAVDSDGTVLLPWDEDNPGRHLAVYEIRNYAYPAADGWRVGNSLDPEAQTTPC